jgi:aspartyl-tRNA(Asn)/glutamyl-tRNA(Gln) amidotransferase subunit A
LLSSVVRVRPHQWSDTLDGVSQQMRTTPRFSGWFDRTPDQRAQARQACSDCIADTGRALNAVVSVSSSSRADGPLLGMPYVTKDIFDRIGRRAEWGGSRVPGVAQDDAEILKCLDRAGAEQIAVTTMTALAYEPSGYNATLGRTRNPWHPDIVSGGSSSGSAAVIAAGAAFLGLGSDTGGSVRIPAACCGVVGLKPGWGMIPTEGAMPLAPSLDSVGFFARAASDLIEVLRCVVSMCDGAPEIAKVAVLRSCVAEATPVIRDAIARALCNLDDVDHITIDADDLVRAADAHTLTVMQAEAARIHDGQNQSSHLADAVLRRRLKKGWAITEEMLKMVLSERSSLRDSFVASWNGADAAVLPVMPMETPLACTVDPTNEQFDAKILYRMSSLTRFVNYLGLPALSLPIGFDNRGAPIGMQLIGRPSGEISLLRFAAAFQRVTNWHAYLPPSFSPHCDVMADAI